MNNQPRQPSQHHDHANPWAESLHSIDEHRDFTHSKLLVASKVDSFDDTHLRALLKTAPVTLSVLYSISYAVEKIVIHHADHPGDQGYSYRMRQHFDGGSVVAPFDASV